MTEHDEVPQLEERIEIQAPLSRVWPLVADVRRMADWSPQVESVRLRDGSPEIGLATRFTNRNTAGELAWITHGEILRFEPERELAFRIEENRVIWSFTLAAGPGGSTLLVQRRETPDGISDLSRTWTDRYMGGQLAFTETMRAGMRSTLDRIRTAAEGSATP